MSYEEPDYTALRESGDVEYRQDTLATAPAPADPRVRVAVDRVPS